MQELRDANRELNFLNFTPQISGNAQRCFEHVRQILGVGNRLTFSQLQATLRASVGVPALRCTDQHGPPILNFARDEAASASRRDRRLYL